MPSMILLWFSNLSLIQDSLEKKPKFPVYITEIKQLGKKYELVNKN